MRLDAVAAATLLAGTLLAMVMRASLRPEIIALALTHTLQLTGMMQWFVRQVWDQGGGRAGTGGGGEGTARQGRCAGSGRLHARRAKAAVLVGLGHRPAHADADAARRRPRPWHWHGMVL